MSKPTNIHHLIGRQHKNEFRIYDERNKVIIDVAKHNWLHNLFYPLNAPKSQFEYINWLRRPIQSEIIKELVDIINATPSDKWYAEGLLK